MKQNLWRRLYMSYNMLFQQAINLHENGQLNQAEQIYRQILEAAPNQPEVLNLLGLIAQTQNVHIEAIDLFYKAIKQAPARADFYYNLAFSLKLWNKPFEAIENFKKALQFNPEIKEAYNELGDIYQKVENHQKAKEAYQAAIEIDKNYIDAKVNLICLISKDKPSLAINELDNLAKFFPNEAIIYYHLSKFHIQNKEYLKAWTTASKAKELAPTSDEVRVILGQLSLIGDKVENAKIYFQKAHLLNEKNISANLALANIATTEHDFIKAEKHYKRILELDANDFDAHANYANMLYSNKRPSEALDEYRKAVVINPKSAEVCNNLAVLLKDIGDYEQALGLFFNALSISPEMEEVSINVAETLVLVHRSGKEDEAMKIADSWQKSAPENVFAIRINAALKGEKLEDNTEYSERLFDNFASNYELVLQDLGYSVPMAMARIIGDGEACIVDLGCGTGLVGEAIKTTKNNIIGVDLSAKMLEIAKEKNIYDKLIKMDVVEYLSKNDDFDMIVAADVFGYIGDLSPLLSHCKNKKLIFSIETTEKENYFLSETGRYQHNIEYVEKLLQDVGYQHIMKQTQILRVEDGNNVTGMIFVAN